MAIQFDNTNTGTVTLAPASSGTVSFTLPSADGTSGQVLQTDGSGALSFATAAAGATGGGSDQVFYENSLTVTTDYTITTNKSALSAGPITINSGITVTVPTGSRWVVV